MKRNLYIFFTLFLVSTYLSAQSGQKTIVDDLNAPKWGQGNVKVMQDETIQSKVAIRCADVVDTVEEPGTAVVSPTNNSKFKGRGYKIQVFMGNNQQQSKREAESKQSLIRNAFPELRTVVSFQSPFWILRAGNFQTKEEAEDMLKDMRKAFPSFGREMTIIRP